MSKTLLALAGLAALALVAAAAATPPVAPYNLDRAIAAQRAEVDARPDDAGAHNDLANLLVLARDYDGAAAAYARALELAPDDAAFRFNRALLLAKQGERLAAFRELKRVVELDPRHAWAHYEIGKCYQAWRVDSLAERAYARAFRIEPRLADVRTNPHVLDNPLATRALLRAHQRADEDLQAPRSYEEPERIAALMLDLPAPAADADQLATEPAAAGEGGFVRSLSGAPGAGGAVEELAESNESADAAEPAKRLTPRDLEPGRTSNQIGGGVAVVGGVAGRPATAGERPAFSGRRVRPGTTGAGPTRPGTTSTPPAGSPTAPFTPGPDSTGRLELRLLPVASATGA